MGLDPDKLTTLDLYRILTGSILPRPIAWVSTVDAAGNPNLAPFSFFTVASVNPPVICFSPLIDATGDEKDTLINIGRTGEFVVNIVSHGLTAEMNQTSAAYAYGVNEFEKVGVAAAPSVSILPPGVEASLVRFECTLQQTLSFGKEPMAGNLVLGNICHIHIHPDIYANGRVDYEALDTVGRLAGDFYSTIRDSFAIARPRLDPDE